MPRKHGLLGLCRWRGNIKSRVGSSFEACSLAELRTASRNSICRRDQLNRSTRALLFACCVLIIADNANAAQRPIGCFARTYDAGHMRGHSHQQVRRLWVRLEDSPYDSGKTIFSMNLWIRGHQQTWSAGGLCEPDGNGWICHPDTDGASKLLLSKRNRDLRLVNPGRLKIEDDRTGPGLNTVNLSGPGDFSYVLRSSGDAACKDTGL